MSRTGECPYCWCEAELTTEHASARWVPRKFPDGDSFAPVMGRHMFAGELTIEDVCGRCNNGRLSELDQYAETWWDRNVREHVTELHADEPKLGRWLAKITFNMQRIDRRERLGGSEPPFPDDAARWVIQEGKLYESLGIVVGGFARGHDFASCAGHNSTNLMPLRWTHFMGLVFMVVWGADNWEVSVEGMTKAICDSMPGVALDLVRGNGPRQVPTIKRPDFVQRGFVDNVPLRIAMTEYWRRREGG